MIIKSFFKLEKYINNFNTNKNVDDLNKHFYEQIMKKKFKRKIINKDHELLKLL